MSLSFEQQQFAKYIGILINYIYASGYSVTFGDAWAHDGHRQDSLHYKRLAIDLNLFDSNGEYLRETKHYKQFGIFWESLHPKCTWGGGFKNPDGNHFSWFEV